MKKSVLLFLVSAAAAAAFADSSVTGITVKQRWPWSDKIDIDFTLAATTNCHIRFSFSHSGMATGRTITNKFSDATLYGVAPGEGHFTMTPADLGIKGKSIANLVVTAEEVASVADRTFLVLDISTGGYEYMAARPSDEWGWTNAVYKGQKMAFRRVPAGTYTVGHTVDELKVVKSSPSADEKSSMGQRQVELTSDYYISIFPVTTAHMAYLYGGTAAQKTTYTVYRNDYDVIRGMTNADERVSVNWPVTGIGEFGNDTFLTRLQTRVGGKLAIDLPTETQWEVAMRAGTTTIFHNGGTSESTVAELQALWLEFAPDNTTEAVGLRAPNQWDIYNPIGMQYYWCLDAFTRTTTAAQEDNKWPGQSGRDPVGQTFTPGDALVRIVRGGGYQTGAGLGSFPGFRRGCPTSNNVKAFRLAIHLADPRIRR